MIRRILAGILILACHSLAQAHWRPHGAPSWHIQFSGPIDLKAGAQVYDLDLFDTSPHLIRKLHRRGRKVICYFSAGSSEDWRPDYSRFTPDVKGKDLAGWRGEKWLDVRRLDVLGPIMQARMALAAGKGCDAVDVDNLDGYANESGFPLTGADQLAYNRFLAQAAHARNLAIGLKNDLNQIDDLVDTYDFAINESCMEYDECQRLLPFIKAGKTVFHIEYQPDVAAVCERGRRYGFSSVKKHRKLDGWRGGCSRQENSSS